MKFFNTLLVSVLISQLALAEKARHRHLERMLERATLQLSEQFIDEVVLEFNKELKKPDKVLKKYNKTLAQIDKGFVLKRDDIKHFEAKKAGTSSLHLYYGKKDYLTMELSGLLARGEIFFNGKKILWEDAQNPQKLYRFMQQHIVSSQKKVSGLFSWLVSDAHAVAQIAVAPLALAATLLMTTVASAAESPKYINSTLRAALREAWQACIDSKNMLKTGTYTEDNKDKIMGVLLFIDEIESTDRIIARGEDNILSCENIKAFKLKKSMLGSLPGRRHVIRMCKLAQDLELCLMETRRLANSKGVNVDDSSRAILKDGPYQDIFRGLSLPNTPDVAR